MHVFSWQVTPGCASRWARKQVDGGWGSPHCISEQIAFAVTWEPSVPPGALGGLVEYTCHAGGEAKRLDPCVLGPAFGQWGTNSLALVV